MNNLKKLTSIALLTAMPLIYGCAVTRIPGRIINHLDEQSIRNQKVNIPISNENRETTTEEIFNPLIDKYETSLKDARKSLNEGIKDRVFDSNEIEDTLKSYREAITNSNEIIKTAEIFGKSNEYSKFLISEDECKLYDILAYGYSMNIMRVLKENNFIIREVHTKPNYFKQIFPKSTINYTFKINSRQQLLP